MSMTTHYHLMNELKQRHKVIAELISDSPVVYLDVPFYRNVGDLLIMQGTLTFFKHYSIQVKFKSSWFNTPESRIGSKDVLVFQGGGNLGDLYYGCQHLRESLIPKFTNNRIIILPQTIHFEDDKKFQRCCELFRKHPDLHICVRDQKSFELARQMTDNVYLLPDMAHQLYPLTATRAAENATLGLFRKDIEALPVSKEFRCETITDWNLMFSNRNKLIVTTYRISRALGVIGLNSLLGAFTTECWIKASRSLTKSAVKLYSRHSHIVTDRLHGHILACLLDKPHVVLDNSYGKNSRYMQCWTAKSDLVTLQIDSAEVIDGGR
ncbi:polysaccharide pyruvyl transferase family protein [Rheinheimera baltica]|uniref:polysaccharide pyruvyl transferase family protein n=1 Tax=Rheinheimera baltica TaxID=67576 RepID=UPI00273D4F70|nr:polysaccharide pyruvyl transferase family protein [Rheinheimera baltica]MDP5149807.1 polysaccharide pyruvyl transferase family protein [Rheinheimera baltica]